MSGEVIGVAEGRNLEQQLAEHDAAAECWDDDGEIKPGRDAEYWAARNRQRALDGQLRVIRQLEAFRVPMSSEVVRHAACQSSRPRERRAARRQRGGASRASPSDPSDPEPPHGRPADDDVDRGGAA